MLYISKEKQKDENNKITNIKTIYEINYTEKEKYSKNDLAKAKLLIPKLNNKKLSLEKWINIIGENRLNDIINEIISTPTNYNFEPNNYYIHIDIMNFRKDIIKFIYENTT